MITELSFFLFVEVISVTTQSDYRALAEFDVTLDERAITTSPMPIEEKVGHSYQLIGHQIAALGENLEDHRESIGETVAEFYAGPLADRTASFVENLQYGSAKVAEVISSILSWLGSKLIKTGEAVHVAAVDLEENSHDDGEQVREKLLEQTPQVEKTISRWIGQAGHRIHQLGHQAEMSGDELANRHRFLENFKKNYRTNDVR